MGLTNIYLKWLSASRSTSRIESIVCAVMDVAMLLGKPYELVPSLHRDGLLLRRRQLLNEKLQREKKQGNWLTSKGGLGEQN